MKWVFVHGFKSFIILRKWVVDSVSRTTSHRVPRFYGMKENTCVGPKKMAKKGRMPIELRLDMITDGESP